MRLPSDRKIKCVYTWRLSRASLQLRANVAVPTGGDVGLCAGLISYLSPVFSYSALPCVRLHLETRGRYECGRKMADNRASVLEIYIPLLMKVASLWSPSSIAKTSSGAFSTPFRRLPIYSPSIRIVERRRSILVLQ
jgi:hypothetical protein